MLDQIDDKDNDNGECLQILVSHQGGQGLCQVRLFCCSQLDRQRLYVLICCGGVMIMIIMQRIRVNLPQDMFLRLPL